MKRQRKTIVSSYLEITENIDCYNKALLKTKGLQGRIGRHPAWYAIQDKSGEWLFGPSKFIGYAHNTAENYLQAYSRLDGKETEPALREWFERVEKDTPDEKHLRAEFRKMASRFGKLPNKRWRVSISKMELGEMIAQPREFFREKDASLSERITADPAICGGRPCIRGTRMRVSDIVEMIAGGATHEEILEDFPYLKKEDIQAALRYAARALDHALVRAA